MFKALLAYGVGEELLVFLPFFAYRKTVDSSHLMKRARGEGFEPFGLRPAP